MKIKDLDDSTRHLIFAAKCMAMFPNNKRLRRLKRAVAAYNSEHEDEQTKNLIRAIFGPDGVMSDSDFNLSDEEMEDDQK